MREPNFFIIGAPKCGTTALSEYIRTHPNVFVTTPKEPNHFSRDFPGFQKYRTDEEYFALYHKATDQHKAVGEASTPYLRSKVAVPELAQRYPNARYIVMLRNPMDVVVSWHAHMLRGLTEDVETFATAWSLSEERRAGRQVPNSCPEPSWLDYKSIALFGEQVQFVLNHLRRDDILFIKFDDFASDPRSIYEGVLSFLGVPSDGRTDFQRVNERRSLRSRRAQRLHLWAVRMRRAIGISDDSPIRVVTKWFADQLRKWNVKAPIRRPIPMATEEEMRSLFSADTEALARLTGLDLTQWKKAGNRNTQSGHTIPNDSPDIPPDPTRRSN